MQVQLRAHSSVEGSEGLTAHVTTMLQSALSRFSERITRVEVRLGDDSGGKVAGTTSVA
jgi:hypothetical protein